MNRLVKIFLDSNLALILILLASVIGLVALGLTPREEDPQIVVPMADVFVQFPGYNAEEVEQLVTTPLEKMLYQIDGVEYVYSMSQADQAVITVRYYVGEDRERSLVKLYKKLDENADRVPPGVTGWVVKPVEIDDVPIVTLTLTSAESDDMALRRVADEVTQRLASVANVSRAYVVGGRPRIVQVLMDPDRMAAHHVSPLELQRALQAANVRMTAGDFRSRDQVVRVEAGQPFDSARQLAGLVVGVFDGHPVRLQDVAAIEDGPDEVTSYVRHGWGPARGFAEHEHFPSTLVGKAQGDPPVSDRNPNHAETPPQSRGDSATFAPADADASSTPSPSLSPRRRAPTPFGSPTPSCGRRKSCSRR
jgi:multidrug efflux pump subunit AcrB